MPQPAGNNFITDNPDATPATTYITSFVKAGPGGVKYDVEGTGYGWKTEMLSKAADSVPPMRCKMERPAQ